MLGLHHAHVDAWPTAAIPRWAWLGRGEVFDALDANGDGVVDDAELRGALGPEVMRLAVHGFPSPVPRSAWNGPERVFAALDLDRNGVLDELELRDGLGPHVQRLLRDEPLIGPALPGGASVGWKGAARWITFKDREDKARYMADAARHDAADPAIQWWVQAFRALPRPEREGAILRFCQRCLRYERDPAWFDARGGRHGIELLDSSAVGLSRGYGDCDLKARVFVALCLAAGVPAEIEPVFRGENGFPHVRARVLRVDDARWDTADPTIVNSSIGALPRVARTQALVQ
jgi:hypothetical protein